MFLYCWVKVYCMAPCRAEINLYRVLGAWLIQAMKTMCHLVAKGISSKHTEYQTGPAYLHLLLLPNPPTEPFKLIQPSTRNESTSTSP